ncbi:hypothetical protein [Stenotrophomonas lactitubi]|uniref:hypothetical protein n=1 Tax=Stenotrophomonas lactitubi TaxID=2045214 RepID=UPI0032096489
MDVRTSLILAAVMLALPAQAQQIRSATGPQPLPKYKAGPPRAHNPGAEPMKCDQFADPRMRLLCADIEKAYVQGEARRQGLPTPSAELVRLPAYGSAESKRLGAACMGGTAMRRLSNGWEQLRNAKGEWLRCRDQ